MDNKDKAEHWTPAEQASFSAWAITEFPNESSQGLISLGSAWKQGQHFATLASQSQAAQPTIDTPALQEFLDAYAYEASCNDINHAKYEVTRKNLLNHIAHIAGTSQATKLGCGGTGKFGDMPCLGCDACPDASQATKAQAEPNEQDTFSVRFIEQRAAQYVRDHAHTEEDTGALVFEFGEAGREYHYTLVELAEDIRGAIGNESREVTDVCNLPPSGWNCSRVFGHAGPCAASPVASVAKEASPVTVKVERNRVQIVNGVQSFMLAHEADTDEELNWYADQLRAALSLITPCVKSDVLVAKEATMDAESVQALNGIPATMRHDEGAIARCHYCGRYSLDRATLSDRQPTCECGKPHGWSGSFRRPGSDAKWSGKAPDIATTTSTVSAPTGDAA